MPASEQRTKASSVKIQNILVPVDFSESSEGALKYASALAQEFRARITLIYVIEPAPFISDLRNVPTTLSDEEIEAKAHHELDLLVEEHIKSPIKAESLVRQGKSYSEIVKAAKQLKADLVVISTHGYTGLKHTLLGSTAERVVRHASCPVLVLPLARR